MLRPLPCYTLFTIASGTPIVKYKGFQIPLVKKAQSARKQDWKNQNIFSSCKTDVTWENVLILYKPVFKIVSFFIFTVLQILLDP